MCKWLSDHKTVKKKKKATLQRHIKERKSWRAMIAHVLKGHVA